MRARATLALGVAATAAVATLTLTLTPSPAGEPTPPLTPAADRVHLSEPAGVVPFVDLGGSPPALVPTAPPLTAHDEQALLTAPDAPVSAAADDRDPEAHTGPDDPDTTALASPAPDTERGEGGEASPEAGSDGELEPTPPPEPEHTFDSSEPEPEPSSDEQSSRSHWDNLADCESGNWIDGGSSFETGSARWDWAKPGTPVPSWGTTIHHGGLQYAPSTWTAFKSEHHPEYAYDATRAEQIEVGERVQAAQGWGAWPVCSKKVGLR